MSKVNRYFDSEVAREVGTDSAIILYNIQFWIEKNQANKTHFYDGKFWTYNSIQAFQKIFDWLSIQNIKTCLKRLEERGYLITGNFNATAYDRTKWYALGNKCISENQPIHLLELTNGLVSSNQPIPYIKPDKKNREENTPQKIQKKGKPLAKDRFNSLGISYSSPDILLNLGDEIISDLCNKYEVSKSQVIFKAKQLDLWRKSNGKTKKDWVATVENAIAKDYGEKKDWIKEAEEKYGITIY